MAVVFPFLTSLLCHSLATAGQQKGKRKVNLCDLGVSAVKKGYKILPKIRHYNYEIEY